MGCAKVEVRVIQRSKRYKCPVISPHSAKGRYNYRRRSLRRLTRLVKRGADNPLNHGGLAPSHSDFYPRSSWVCLDELPDLYYITRYGIRQRVRLITSTVLFTDIPRCRATLRWPRAGLAKRPSPFRAACRTTRHRTAVAHAAPFCDIKDASTSVGARVWSTSCCLDSATFTSADPRRAEACAEADLISPAYTLALRRRRRTVHGAVHGPGSSVFVSYGTPLTLGLCASPTVHICSQTPRVFARPASVRDSGVRIHAVQTPLVRPLRVIRA